MKLAAFRQQLQTNRHRTLCLLSGSHPWQIQQINQLYASNNETLLSIGPQTIAGLIAKTELEQSERLKYRLGQEIDGAILTLENGLDANQLGIVSGMIRAGGLLFLLTRSENWQQTPNPENARFLNSPLTPNDAFHDFYQHLHQTWQQNNTLWLIENNQNTQVLQQPFLKTLPAAKASTHKVTATFNVTPEQHTAIQNIHKVAFGHRKRPLVLSADRGRGKSSVLGIAAIELLLAGKQHIAVTASRIDQAAKIFEKAAYWLKNSVNAVNLTEIVKLDLSKGKISFFTSDAPKKLKKLEFIAPDELVLTPTAADILMVDEAAFLPTSLLTELLKRHHRMVFATTLHGYEGSGRGFEIRFKQILNQLTPNWNNQHIHQPVRWAENDPLEQAINQALLLDVEIPTELTASGLNPSLSTENLQITETSARTLQAENRLHATFALLVQAHYQTSPNDLQQLLSTPNLKLFIVFDHLQPDRILGVCLAIEEGNLSIANQKQRVHGHLVPQLLSEFYDHSSILHLKSWRIMRIAVHPEVRNLGIGTALIEHLKGSAKKHKLDYLSSSFGVSTPLLNFWQNLQFQAIHLGNKRDKASGRYNFVVTLALSAPALQTLAGIQKSFEQQFPHSLVENLPYLSNTLVWQLLAKFQTARSMSKQRQVLQAFAAKNRHYDSISGELWSISLQLADKLQQLPTLQQEVWCAKILKKHPWQEVAHQHHLSGKKAVEQMLIEAAKSLLKILQPHCNPENESLEDFQ